MNLALMEFMLFSEPAVQTWRDYVLSHGLSACRLASGNLGWKAALGGVATTYFAHRYGAFGSIAGGVCKALPFVRAVAVRCGMEPVKQAGCPGDAKSTLESLRVGSIEQKMTAPGCQATVGFMESGVFTMIGAAIRISDWLVMPAHVYASAGDDPVVYGKQSWISLKGHEYEELDTDLIAIKLSGREWSTVGVSIAVIAHSLGLKGTFVSITGVKGTGTTGTLRHDKGVFGRVVYTGSTVPGYSGAPYMAGRQLVGLHTNGGAINGGYSASYLLSMLNWIDKKKDEDSEDWLSDPKNGSEIQVDETWGDLDTIRLFRGGRYHIVERKSMVAAFGKDWRRSARDYGDYDDYTRESLSKNGETSGASNSLKDDVPELSPERLAFLKMLNSCSTKRLETFASLLKSPEDSSILEAFKSKKEKA